MDVGVVDVDSEGHALTDWEGESEPSEVGDTDVDATAEVLPV